MVHQGRKRQSRRRASCYLVKIHHLLPSVIQHIQFWSVPECAELHLKTNQGVTTLGCMRVAEFFFLIVDCLNSADVSVALYHWTIPVPRACCGKVSLTLWVCFKWVSCDCSCITVSVRPVCCVCCCMPVQGVFAFSMVGAHAIHKLVFPTMVKKTIFFPFLICKLKKGSKSDGWCLSRGELLQ